ncbi:hypothetical protein BU25DRAFT_407021 [Macroventuria anomochaeta]|uniref:Uncharacterized protein n=1 Tax=Macroventuria anomochaeta TaxID=301207 RepID=A0ACB6SAP8_9PLEO|nr:uncharacterized protein BU25DRAFT_407021 [Macroventuria anomochaeta]KAF2631355.1 hypothetical protein BU25DRAFT_407021 [Macroventuria anomochaeta]
MQRLTILRSPKFCPKRVNVACTIQSRYSSGSPTKTNVPADHFIKTGEKPQDPADKVGRSDEYSQSGGDDMVAQQSGASFDGTTDNDIEVQKERAGKGNVVNPLEFSPATSELSSIISEEYTSKSEERKPGDVSGQSSGRKMKTVKKTEIDFK